MKINKKSSIRAFTLIEIMMVVTIIGILAAVAIPSFSKYIKKSKTSEARTNLRKIYDGEVVYFMEEHVAVANGPVLTKQFVTVPATPASIPGVNKVSGNWETSNWQAIKFSADSPVLYQYQVATAGTGSSASFTARALGNIDGDAFTSLFERVGTVNSNGDEIGGAGVYFNQELE